MFSFHKPKVYRSPQGCCICKAKSSSSRFTDSAKYETDFKECFQLIEPRQGEICNACVLLVKRFKRLPPGNRRHWSHVVDARIGPGIKSMTKFKKRMEEQLLQQNGSTEFAGLSNTNAQNIRNNTVTERFGKILKKIRPKKPMLTRSRDENLHPTSPSSSSDNENDENRMSDASDRLECDEQMSPIKGSIPSRHAQRKQKKPMKNRSLARNMSVIDLNVWKKRKACCGVFYEYKQIGAILLESSQFLVNSCSVHCKSLPLVEKSEEWLKLPTAITSLPPKKKHLLRQSMMDAAPVQPMEQSAPIDYSTHTSTQSRPASNLHKVRGDSGKVTKKTPKKKLSDLSAVKNLVKLCTASKLTKSPIDNKYQPLQANEHNENKNITNTATAEPIAVNKFSDNSSDSGYDDLMHDTTQLSQIAQNGAVRPVILSNGIKLHVKPENLLLAANLAGVSQRVIRTTQASMMAIQAEKERVGSPVVTIPSMPMAPTYRHVDVKKNNFIVAPSVLTVTNNS